MSRPPLLKSGCTPNPPAVMLPSPPGGGGSCSADPKGRSTLPVTPRRTPRHLSPSRAESGPAVQYASAALPAIPSLAPHSFAPPLAGRVVGASLPAGSPAKRPQLVSQLFSVSNSPSWADVVRNGKPPSPPPPAATTATTTPATADFLALYERCVCNGLKTHPH